MFIVYFIIIIIITIIIITLHSNMALKNYCTSAYQNAHALIL